MIRRRQFRRKKRLAVVSESEEPNEEPSPYTSQTLRLGIVQPGHYVEWASLGSTEYGSTWELHEPTGIVGGEDTLDEEEDIENEDDAASSSSYYDDDLINQIRSDLDEERKAAQLVLQMLKQEKEEWERTNFTLISWKGKRGEAELIRLLFSASGTPLYDHRVTDEEWDTLKFSLPVKTLPVLTKCGVVWSVPDAIIRMLSKKFRLLGTTNDEHLIVDATYERLRRVQNQSAKAIDWVINMEKNKDKLEWAQSQLLHVILPPCLQEWEQQIRRSDGPFIIESGLSMADIAIMDFLDQCSSSLQIDPLLSNYLAVSDLIAFVKADSRIAVYLEDRNKDE